MIIKIPDTTFPGIPNFIPLDEARTSHANAVARSAIDHIMLNSAIGREDIQPVVMFSSPNVI